MNSIYETPKSNETETPRNSKTDLMSVLKVHVAPRLACSSVVETEKPKTIGNELS